MFTMKNPYNGVSMNVRVTKAKYWFGDRLAVQIWSLDQEYNFWEPWSTMTVNLPDEVLTDENCAFIDTNDNHGIEEFIMANNLGEPTGRVAVSGWCTYPEYRINTALLEEEAPY